MMDKEKVERLTSQNTAEADRENEKWRENMGEASKDIEPKKEEEYQSSSSSSESEAGTVEGEIDASKLPCRKKKRAVQFIKRLQEDPHHEVKGHLIFHKGKPRHKLTPVLQHFFGQEKLSATSARKLERFVKSNKNKKGIKVKISPPSKKVDRKYHPDLTATWKRLKLTKE